MFVDVFQIDNNAPYGYRGIELPHENVLIARIFVEGDPTGQPLVTAHANAHLPAIRDIYAEKWIDSIGTAGLPGYFAQVTIRFDGVIRDGEKLTGSISINLGVEGTTGYKFYRGT